MLEGGHTKYASPHPPCIMQEKGEAEAGKGREDLRGTAPAKYAAAARISVISPPPLYCPHPQCTPLRIHPGDAVGGLARVNWRLIGARIGGEGMPVKGSRV